MVYSALSKYQDKRTYKDLNNIHDHNNNDDNNNKSNNKTTTKATTSKHHNPHRVNSTDK
jgi:hypothetical protein